MSSEEEKSKIILRSNDGREFKISKEEARVSCFCVDTLNLDDDPDDEEDEEAVAATAAADATAVGQGEKRVVDVLRVSGPCLAHVVEFMVHYAKHKMPEITLPMNGDTFNEVMKDRWYQEYPANLETEELFEIVAAANYMTIKPLLDLSCLWLTFEMQGKSANEIREMLNAPELSAEEEARARRDHGWLFENEMVD